MTEKDAINAAKVLENWCKEKKCSDCPFSDLVCFFTLRKDEPKEWYIEGIFRTRGLKDET